MSSGSAKRLSLVKGELAACIKIKTVKKVPNIDVRRDAENRFLNELVKRCLFETATVGTRKSLLMPCKRPQSTTAKVCAESMKLVQELVWFIDESAFIVHTSEIVGGLQLCNATDMPIWRKIPKVITFKIAAMHPLQSHELGVSSIKGKKTLQYRNTALKNESASIWSLCGM